MNKPAQISLDQTVGKSDSFVESNVDGETILMHLDEGNFSTLKSTAVRIWAHIDEPKTVAEVCQRLMTEFDVEESVCQNHTIAFLEDLQARGLVEIREP